ncbi:ABC transporter ATP-binding protein, partial [Vibrio campbellii]
GYPIEDVSYESLRDNMAVVLQQPAIFNDTLRHNLTLGNSVYSDEQLWQALAIAQLKEVVEALSEGLDSPLGRNGVR